MASSVRHFQPIGYSLNFSRGFTVFPSSTSVDIHNHDADNLHCTFCPLVYLGKPRYRFSSSLRVTLAWSHDLTLYTPRADTRFSVQANILEIYFYLSTPCLCEQCSLLVCNIFHFAVSERETGFAGNVSFFFFLRLRKPFKLL